jgi:hypothetical protein
VDLEGLRKKEEDVFGRSRSSQQQYHISQETMLLATFKLCAGSSYRHMRNMKGESLGGGRHWGTGQLSGNLVYWERSWKGVRTHRF